jgi:hypothetical protein
MFFIEPPARIDSAINRSLHSLAYQPNRRGTLSTQHITICDMLETKVEKHDEEIQAIFEAIRQLMAPPPQKPKRPIGF